MTAARPTFSSIVLFTSVLTVAAGLGAAACDKDEAPSAGPATSATPAALPDLPPPPDPTPQPPEIIVDRGTVAVGKDTVSTSVVGLDERVAALATGKPAVEGRAVDFVAMRGAKPSAVAAVALGLRRARASSANVKSEARDSTTQTVPLSFVTHVPDCSTVAWIAKDAAIVVWPAGGGVAKRVVRGLAGPDLTLGLAAVRERWEGCGSSQIVVGADDAMTWGLAFDLAEAAVHAPGARVSDVVLLTSAVPGHKVVLR